AAGRIDVGTHVVELLEADEFAKARGLAGLLDARNRERQKLQREVTESAILEASSFPDPNFVVVAAAGWHKGVVGLAASRVAERFHRPAIVFSIEEGIATGSARSIAGFDLFEALRSAEDLLETFGGHVAAAGMKTKESNIDALRQRLDAYAAQLITGDARVPELKIDAVVTPQTLNLSLVEDLAMFEPFGAGNPKPVFVTRGLYLAAEPFVMKEKHLKLKLASGDGHSFEAVWWDGVERSKGQTLSAGTGIEVAYVADANSWQGNTRLQLVVQDLRADN
ncbi:MAG: DHH family phosphoesterase, partial [Pyrinomonadaceae bacterium]|nr:DHH family phosphoesterase [Pyrinomonadaceae bacterium]